MDTLLPSIIQSIVEMPAIEIIAATTGILSVWFARSKNVLVYPTGIVSVLLYVFICFQWGLYADALVNAYYFIMSLYGWYFWLHGGKQQAAEEYERTESLDEAPDYSLQDLTAEQAHISANTFPQNLAYLAATALLFVMIGWLLDAYTDSTVAWVDAFTTSVFIVAMYAMAKKKIEHWIFWIIGDAVSIPLYMYKGLPVTACQYGIFLVIAIWGFAVWFRDLEKQVTDYEKSSKYRT
jgi:nicotinamide mononucleotide transporter